MLKRGEELEHQDKQTLLKPLEQLEETSFPHLPKCLAHYSTPSIEMVELNLKTLEREIKPREVMTTNDASLSQKANVDLAALMRTLHEDPNLRIRDQSTKTHYMSRFVFKVNSTLSITKVSLNKDLTKSQDLGAHTL